MISQQEYKARRQKLAKQLPIGSVALISAGKEYARNADTHFRFRQDSTFFYLTGFNEEHAVLVLFGDMQDEIILFCQPHDADAERWTGKRLGIEGALSHLGMSKAFEIGAIDKMLPDILANKTSIYFAFSNNFLHETLITPALNVLKNKIRQGINPPCAFFDLDPITSEMRLFKSPSEIDIMKTVAKHSAMAHQSLMKSCSQMTNEYELEALFTYELQRVGCREMAYPPIVGSGENSCTLHYTDNNQPLVSGDLVLVDAGGELNNYAADITRTFPVNGRFNEAQKDIYNLVLKAQRAGIAAIKPGLLWNEVQNIIVRILTEGLCALGILVGDVDELIASEAYKAFYMHRSGHWLGLDVHDCGAYKKNGQWRPLLPGMVLTVEPGLYISKNATGVDKRYWGIGVRIEDDILVTNDGHEILSKDAIVSIEDIEELMRG